MKSGPDCAAHPLHSLARITLSIALAYSAFFHEDLAAEPLSPPLTLNLSWSLSPPPSQGTHDPAQRLSWVDALEKARLQPAAIRAAVAQVQAQNAVEQQAWAQARMPNTALTMQWQHDRIQYPTYTTQTPKNTLGISATLPIWYGAERALERAQIALTQRTHWQERQTRMLIAREVSAAYLQAVEAAAQLDLVDEQRSLLTKQLHLNDQRLRGGVGSSLDQLETTTRLDLLRSDLHERHTRYETQRLVLSRLLGQEIPAIDRMAASALLADNAGPIVVAPLSEDLARISEQSPSVQDAQAQVHAAQAQIRARDAEGWEPRLDAVASTTRTHQTTHAAGLSESLHYTENTIGVQLNVPLYTGGRQSGRHQEATALLTKAQAERDDALAKAQTDLLTAHQQLKKSLQQVRALRDVEYTAQTTLSALQRAFVAGYRSNIDLLNAQQQLIAVRSQSVTARINVMLAQVEILSLTEKLDANTVRPLAQWMARPNDTSAESIAPRSTQENLP